MMRFARVASVLAFGLLSGVAVAQAQTPAAQTNDSPFYLDFTVGATLGHKSSGSVGAEGGMRVMPNLDAFVEGGHMSNVGSQDLDNRAALIANAVGAMFSAAYKVNYFDGGVRYHWPATLKVHPYLAFGLGVAHVRSETILNVTGTPTVIVQYGNDLNGSVNKALMVIGGGVTVPIAKRYFGDLSYRYGRIFARTSEIENDSGINTNRVQIAIGARF